ncbi:predicted protein [Naegleria gruberi]|uniref:Predicted protein n=1 Tax=Naegleria gruberi TaxID=5762 RepID=D2VFS2_NAEGR|nr:uncharacterized protein NAEGRDRAFT_67724 [Naegleria gruberi]EFC44520.1 predicted protein [Naegleria gruberi]|eukprot:XP_002677264.1 predicted protein [Naegleria gruberi strain NEG-M]
MNTLITSDEDMEYETESSLRKLNVLNSKRRFSFQSSSEAGDNFSTGSSVTSFKRPSTPQPTRANASKELSRERPSSSRGARPNSAPKKSHRLTHSAPVQPPNIPTLKMLNNQPLPTFDDEQTMSLKRDARAIDDLKLVLAEEQTENIRLEKSNEALRNEIISLKTQIKNLNLDCETFRTANENLLAEAEENKKKFDRIQRNYRNIQQLYKEEKQKRITIEENRVELQKQVSKMRVALHQHKSKLEIDHREKTQTFDMVKEQHDQTKNDINVLLEYISVMEQYNIQQQKQFEELSTILEGTRQEEVKEITQSILSSRSSVSEQNPELTEKVKSILETYNPERSGKKNSRMRGNPNVRNFNDFRHLAHSKANCSTYHWETSLRHGGDSKKQQGVSNMNSNVYVSSPNTSNIIPSLEPRRLPQVGQNITPPQQPIVQQPRLNAITIPSVSPEKQKSLQGENPQPASGSSNIFKIIEEQSQNLITQLKSNESFNNSYEDKVDYLTSFEDTHTDYSTNYNYNRFGVNVLSSSENLFSFTPTKDEEIAVVTDTQPTPTMDVIEMDEQPPITSNDDPLNASTTSSKDNFFSKLSPQEIHHLLSELVKQQQIMSTTTTSVSSSTLEHSATTNTSTTLHSRSDSNTTNDDMKIKEESSLEPSTEEEVDIKLTRDIHFPSPEQNILNTSPYKNEREMIVKQRLHERLALERRKMGVGLDM